MTPTKTPVKVQEKHVFTSAEREEYLAQLLQAMSHKGEIEAEFKTAKSTFKSKIDAKDAEIKLVQNLLTNGFEYQQTSCYIVKNFEEGKREYYEFDTDRLVQTEPLSAKDYQLDLKDTEAKIAANNETADQLQEVIDEKVEEAYAEPISFEEATGDDQERLNSLEVPSIEEPEIISPAPPKKPTKVEENDENEFNWDI